MHISLFLWTLWSNSFSAVPPFACGLNATSFYTFACSHLMALCVTTSEIQRIATKKSRARSILNCWYAFQVYHAVKIDHRSAVDSAVVNQDFSEIWMLVLELIATFAGAHASMPCNGANWDF